MVLEPRGFAIQARFAGTDAFLTINSTITDSTSPVGLTKSGPGNLILGSASNFSGPTYVSAGALTLGQCAGAASSHGHSVCAAGGGDGVTFVTYVTLFRHFLGIFHFITMLRYSTRRLLAAFYEVAISKRVFCDVTCDVTKDPQKLPETKGGKPVKVSGMDRNGKLLNHDLPASGN